MESVFYWICGSQIFSLETLMTVTVVSVKAIVHWLAVRCCRWVELEASFVELHVAVSKRQRPG